MTREGSKPVNLKPEWVEYIKLGPGRPLGYVMGHGLNLPCFAALARVPWRKMAQT
jgi:hypothetical protein